MTKYVLNSGGLRNNPRKTREFFAEILKGLGSSPRVLFCFFATGREYWEEKFAEYTHRFRALAPKGVEPYFILGMPDTFIEQVTQSDAIILHGGDDHLLQYWLRKFNVPAIWDCKVVAGSSAGSDALSRQFWTCDWRKCMDGLGVVSVKFLPHYQSNYGSNDPRGPIDWEKALLDLKEYGDRNLPVYALQEGHYVVVEC